MKNYSEADARIVINDLLRQAGWDPADKSQVLTEFQARLPISKIAETQAEYGTGPSRRIPDGDEIPTRPNLPLC